MANLMPVCTSIIQIVLMFFLSLMLIKAPLFVQKNSKRVIL